MKNILKIGVILVAGLSLTACGGSSCSTKEDLEAKVLEMNEKMQKVVASGDMSKVAGLFEKMKSYESLSGSKDEIADTCKLIDDLIDEL